MIFKIIKSDIMKKAIIETEKGTIEFFVVMDHKFWKFWKSNGEFNITINQIKKIGTDVILVDQII